MRRASIKLIVRITLLGAAAVTTATVVVAWPLLVAEWHIFQLTTGDLETQTRAAGKLGALQSERAVPKLVEVFEGTLGSSLTSPEGSLGIVALSALGKIGPAGENGLIAAQAKWDPAMRKAMLGAAKELPRQDARPLFTAVARVLEDDDPSVRIATLEALASFKAPAERNIPVLMKMLSDPDLAVQREALSLLRTWGTPANTAWPAILGMAESRRDALARAARATHLRWHRWKRTADFDSDLDWALREILAGDDAGLRARAANLLEQLPQPERLPQLDDETAMDR